MSVRPNDIAVSEHVSRSERHKTVGTALIDAGDEWGAVCLFYSAYHLIRHCLRTDPFWNDASKVAALNPELAMEDRGVQRHSGRKNTARGREWGVNELVGLMYGSAAARPYERLHQASIAVRYGPGFSGPLEALMADLEELERLRDEGHLQRPTD